MILVHPEKLFSAADFDRASGPSIASGRSTWTITPASIRELRPFFRPGPPWPTRDNVCSVGGKRSTESHLFRAAACRKTPGSIQRADESSAAKLYLREILRWAQNDCCAE